MRPEIVFAIPGDPDTRTGGYIYDRHLAEGLRRHGAGVRVLRLPDTFPEPDAADMADALSALADVPDTAVLLIDGLAYGALDPVGVAQLAAPVVALVHHPLALETGVPTARARALGQTEAANLAIARHVVVTSPATRDTLIAEYGVAAPRITVALPGTARAMPGVPTRPPLILSVGTLTRRKGHDTLLQALARIADLDWTAEILGGARDAAVADELTALRATLGLDARVAFGGEVDDLAPHYGRATVFALATRHEGYGMVLAEALAHGLPVVSCAVGAVPQTVPADAGILVPADDAGAFGAALRTVLVDAGRSAALRAGAVRAAAALPGWDDTARLVDAVIRRIVA